MAIARSFVAAITVAVLAGCGGAVRHIPMKDGAGGEQTVDLPKGTVFGGASQDQAAAIAQMVAATNTAAAERSAAAAAANVRVETGVQQLQADVHELQAGEKRDEESLRRLEAEQKRVGDEVRQAGADLERIGAAAQKIEVSVSRVAEGQARVEEVSRETLDTAKKTWDTTRMIIEAFEKLSRRQGTGEVTVFFAKGSARIARAGLQERRLVEFADWLGRESRGRKIMFVAIGSASATGPGELNAKLAKQRSEALLGVVDQYLVNVPHEYVKLYGTGDAYSPKGAGAAEHERYQHARLIAFFEKGQEPALPAEP
jgi:flagellar biosynthesis chaperone FliJ